MKLKNKKTGEVATLTLSSNGEDLIIMGNDMLAHITNISELKDYEDYEEEKRYWYIDADGEIMSKEMAWFNQAQDDIGNRFETKEEAEKAAEKLKAWKRLKDKGFKFTGVAAISNNIGFETDSKYRSGHVMYDEYSNTDNKLKEYNDDLMLLFGGEE